MKIQSAKPYFPEESIKAINEEVKDILTSGRLILGKYTERFEKEFAKYTGVKHAIAINTCTSALVTSLRFLNVKDREIIVPSNTFIATPNSVTEAGGKFIFGEIKKETLCLDPNDIRKKITKKTKAVIAVHMLGCICPEIYEIKEICKENNLALIEDAAHAHGAEINGKKSGSLGEIGCFSFFPSKVMTTMVGGMLTTDNNDLVNFAKSVRFFGSGENLSWIVRKGDDWLLGEINAVLGLHQLKLLDENVKKRNEIASAYNQELQDNKNVKLFRVPKNIVHTYYKYPILLPAKFDLQELIDKMKSKYDIETTRVYVPCHLQPFYKEKFGFKEGFFPVTEDMLNRTICLPMHPGITEEQQKYIIESFKKEIV
ncbi:DegT/DnrJ/EryC1/StrS family aminotransferase [archaeon AH-315-M20]|nr:DegT/DnrJ/EryC1/StrS family aminotransferase [archaeon AH-315-M20]